MIDIFSDYLRELRERSALSQTAAIHKLCISDPDFKNIDSVTFSRWERKITKPHRARQISVIRVFTNDLSEYLSRIYRKLNNNESSKIKFLESRIHQRYANPYLIMSTSSYDSTIHNYTDDVTIEALSSDNIDVFCDNLKHFFNSVRRLKVDYGLSNTDFLKFHNERRIIFQRSVVDGKTYGHTIKAFFKHDDITNEIKRFNRGGLNDGKYLDLNLTTSFNSSEPFSCYMVSQYAMTEKVLRTQLSYECKFLAENANIHFLYKKITLKTSLDIMLNIGFEIVSYGSESPVGEIRIGKKNYSWAILLIPTNQLLSRPEFMYFMSN